MQITQQNIDALNAVLKIEVKVADYEPKVTKALKDYRKQADMKGFRKGQVPMGMIKNMYGNRVLIDTVNDTLSQELNNYIIDNKIDVLGHPMPKDGQQFDMEINSMKDFDFEYEIGLAPLFETKYLDSKPKFDREVAIIDEKIINEEIANLQKRYGKVEEVEDKIQEDDLLSVRLQEMDGKEIKEGGIDNSTSVSLEMIKDAKVKKAAAKLKKGGDTTVDVFSAFDKDEDAIAKHILGTELAQLGDARPSFKMTVEAIKRVQPAEINEEFLKPIYGDAVKNEDELKAKIEEDLKGHFDKQADAKLYTTIADALIDKTEMELPDTFLKRWIMLTNEKPITQEDLDKDYPAFQKNLRWSLIIKKIGSENNIDVAEEEVKAKTAEQIAAQMAAYGMNDMPEAELQNFVGNMMARKDHVDQTKQAILEEKIFDFFKGKVTVKDKKVSLEEFNKVA